MLLTYHLDGALKDLRDIIEITKQDIEDIKAAKADAQFDRLPLKEEKISSFEAKKAMIDHEISKLMTSNPNKELPSLLNQEQHAKLDELKQELHNLKEINQHYARMVLTVSSLYNEFLERLVPTEMDGYEKKASKDPSLLEIRV
jgi:cystathionine beta-lyase family protein involved in aluminum resistance